MCTGVELAVLAAAAAASAGGAYIQNQESSDNNARIAQARNKELRDTLARNQEISDRSRDIFKLRQEEVAPEATKQRQEELTTDRTDKLTDVVTGENPENVPIKGSAPQVVKSEIAKKFLAASDKAKANAKALGTLGGYGDLWLDQGLKDTDAGLGIGVQQNLIKGNMGILPYSQDFAGYQAYRPSSGIGEMMQAAGSVLGGAAGSGAVGKGAKYVSSLHAPTPGLIF